MHGKHAFSIEDAKILSFGTKLWAISGFKGNFMVVSCAVFQSYSYRHPKVSSLLPISWSTRLYRIDTWVRVMKRLCWPLKCPCSKQDEVVAKVDSTKEVAKKPRWVSAAPFEKYTEARAGMIGKSDKSGTRHDVKMLYPHFREKLTSWLRLDVWFGILWGHFCHVQFASFVFASSIENSELFSEVCRWKVGFIIFLQLSANQYGSFSLSLLSSGVSVALRSRCGGKWGVLVLKSPLVPEVQRGRSSQGLTVITGAPSGKSRMRTRGRLVAAGESVDLAGTVRDKQTSLRWVNMKLHTKGFLFVQTTVYIFIY